VDAEPTGRVHDPCIFQRAVRRPGECITLCSAEKLSAPPSTVRHVECHACARVGSFRLREERECARTLAIMLGDGGPQKGGSGERVLAPHVLERSRCLACFVLGAGANVF
jgi:hypothetical protein